MRSLDFLHWFHLDLTWRISCLDKTQVLDVSTHADCPDRYADRPKNEEESHVMRSNDLGPVSNPSLAKENGDFRRNTSHVGEPTGYVDSSSPVSVEWSSATSSRLETDVSTDYMPLNGGDLHRLCGRAAKL